MHTFKSTDISEVTLLSVKEAKEIPQDILQVYGKWWWLRSPGYRTNDVAYVDEEGDVNEEGDGVGHENGIRPVFLIPNLKSSNLKIGDIIEVAGTEAIVISDDMALAKEPVENTCFREDWKAEDANEYEASGVKKWLDDW